MLFLLLYKSKVYPIVVYGDNMQIDLTGLIFSRLKIRQVSLNLSGFYGEYYNSILIKTDLIVYFLYRNNISVITEIIIKFIPWRNLDSTWLCTIFLTRISLQICNY